MLGADEMKTVVIVVHAIVNADPIELDGTRLNDAHRMKGALIKENIADREVLTAMKEEMVRPLSAAASGGWRNTALGTAKLRTLTIDGSRSFDRNVLGINGKNQANIAVPEG